MWFDPLRDYLFVTTGRGLYLSRELGRRMNGRIHVDSTEGSGATFTVELPIAR